MEIEFANGFVPIWKVRLGSVVRLDSEDYGELYFHVKGFGNGENLRITVGNSLGFDISYPPYKLVWLEPM